MVRKALLVHGWDGNPENAWFPWLKKELENKGFEVYIPEMPDSEEPEINAWVNKLKEFDDKLNEESYLIGHSIGCQAVLRYLEKSENKKFRGVILVAPWMSLDEQTIREEGEEVWKVAEPWVKTPILFEKVLECCDDFSVIYSTNDPYGNSDDLELLKRELKARTINSREKGHFDDEAGITELPEVLDVIEELESEGEK